MMMLLLIILLLLVKVGSVNVTISDLRQKQTDLKHTRLHRKDITFGSSHIQSIALHKTHEEAEHWQVDGRLIYAIPNTNPGLLINSDEISGAVVLFDYAENDQNTDKEDLTQLQHYQHYHAKADGGDITHTFCELQHHNATAAIIVDTSKEETKKTALHIVRQADENRWKLCNLSRFHAVVVSFEDGKRLKDRCVVCDISNICLSHICMPCIRYSNMFVSHICLNFTA